MDLHSSTTTAIGQYFATQPVLRAYLFGSYARGDADEESDIDILVNLDYSQNIGLRFVTMKLENSAQKSRFSFVARIIEVC